ncbi:ubiquinone/menaquinone biosynthesis methyltransferase [Lyngbya sp. PCC 8106]|nr:ubiquinone/menaquinone biosynthesis methyltransferase [Lyngbya sp. PCC 8106]
MGQNARIHPNRWGEGEVGRDRKKLLAEIANFRSDSRIPCYNDGLNKGECQKAEF